MCKPNRIKKVWIVTDMNTEDFLESIDNIIKNRVVHDIKIAESPMEYTALLIQYAEVF